MTWWGGWDSGQLSKVASAALKNAQKRIDKVLDIPESEDISRRKSLNSDSKHETNYELDSSDHFSTLSINTDTLMSETSTSSIISHTSSDKTVKHSSLGAHSNHKTSKTSTKKIARTLPSEALFEEWPSDSATSPQPNRTILSREGDWVTNDSMSTSSLSAFISTSKEPLSDLPDPRSEYHVGASTTEEQVESSVPCGNSTETIHVHECVALRSIPCHDIDGSTAADSHCSSSDTVSNTPTVLESSALSTSNIHVSSTFSTTTLPSQADACDDNCLSREEVTMMESVASCPSSIFTNYSAACGTEHDAAVDKCRELSPTHRLVHSDITWHDVTHSRQERHEEDELNIEEPSNNMVDSSSYIPLGSSPECPIAMSPLSVDALLDSCSTENTVIQSLTTLQPSALDTRQDHNPPLSPPTLGSPHSENSGHDMAIHFNVASGVAGCTGFASISDVATTCTSSDIEVISSCCASSINGDVTNPFLSTLTHVANVHASVSQQSAFSHKRTASGSNLLNVTTAIRNMQSMPQTNNSMTAELLMKKLVECRQLLESRENKLLEQNRENILLREELSELKYSIEKSHDEESATHTNIERLTQEFTERLQNAEKRFQMASRERDQLKKQIQRLEIELASKNDNELVSQVLQEKEDQIAGLLREGEQLAQEQMKKSVLIKNLRLKEKELETQNTKLNEKVSKLTLEMDQIKKQLALKEDSEKKHVEGISQLTKSVQWQEREMARLKAELEEALTKSRGYQNALETSAKENLGAIRQVQALQTELESLKSQLTNEESGKENWERREIEWMRERDQYNNDLVDLRTALSRKEREMSRLEENLRSEISYYQERLSAAEERNEELSQSLSSATKPVLRQLEALQANYAQENANWEKLESSLNARLVECQRNLVLSTQQERVWRDKVSELEAQLGGIEVHNANLRQESHQLQRDLVEEKKHSNSLQMEMDNVVAEKEKIRQSLEAKLATSSKEIVLLQGVIDAEKHKVEAEKMKYAQLKAEFVVFSQMNPVQKPASSNSLSQDNQVENNPVFLNQTMAFTTTNSLGDGEESVASQGSGLQMDSGRNSTATINASSSRSQLYDSMRGNYAFASQANHAAVMEYLRDLLKQKDGEVLQLHREMQQLQRARDTSANEMARLHALVEQKTAEVDSLTQRLNGLQNLEMRYQALLQLYGEKLEENEELRLDLQDVKEMYKSQIAMLLQEK